MTDATYGWSALKADGARLFVLGPVVETAMTSVATYATQPDFAAAQLAYEASLIPFASLQSNRAEAIDDACAAAITGGYASSALGTPHWYGSRMTDQANLDADMMAAAQAGSGASVTALITCSPDSGVTWSPASHNAAQIGQLWSDFRAFRIACQAKRRTLQAEVAAAASPTALAAIVWA